MKVIQVNQSSELMYQDIAAFVKQEFDKRFGTTWHVIVGRNFGSYVTHETRHFIYFYLGQIAFLIFKYSLDNDAINPDY